MVSEDWTSAQISSAEIWTQRKRLFVIVSFSRRTDSLIFHWESISRHQKAPLPNDYQCQNCGPLTCVLCAAPPACRAPAPGSVIVCCLFSVNCSLPAWCVQAWALTSSEDSIISRLGLGRIFCASSNVTALFARVSVQRLEQILRLRWFKQRPRHASSAPRSLHLLLSDEKITRPPPRHRAVSISGRGKLRTRGRGSRVIFYQSYFFEAIGLCEPT